MFAPSGRDARSLLVSALLVLGTAAAVLGPGLAPDRTFALRDLAAYHRPCRALLRPLVEAAGGVPLWNPFFAFGQPFAANPVHQLFHPLTWTFLLLPFEWAFRLQVVVPPLAGAAGGAFLARTLGLGPSAAAWTALSWGLGGAFLSATQFLPISFGAAALPWVVAFAARLAARGGARDVAAFGLSLGLAIVAGEPSTIATTLAFALVPFVPGVVPTAVIRVGGRGSSLARLAAALALGFLAGAAAWLPASRVAARSTRAEGLGPEHAGLWSLPPSRLAEVLPAAGRVGPFGSSDPGGVPASLYPGRDGPLLLSLYGGFGLFVLAVGGLVVRPRSTWPWLAAGAVALLLAVGTHTPVWGAARAAPLLNGLRYPEKFALGGLFALTLAGASGADRLAARRPTLAMLLVAGTAVDLAAHGRRLVQVAPLASVSVPPPVLRSLVAEGGGGPVFNHAAYRPRGLSPVAVASPPVPAGFGLPTVLEHDFDLTQLAWSTRLADATSRLLQREPDAAGPILSRLGVHTVLRWRPGSTGPDGADLETLRLTESANLAFFASATAAAADADSWIAVSRRAGKDRATLVCLEPDDLAGVPASPSPGRAEVRAAEPGDLRFEVSVTGPGPGVLAVNTTWAPEWRASVDGAPATLRRADLGLSAILVPAGAREVRLRYRDPLVTTGMAASLAALLVAAACAVSGARGPVRPRPRP